MTTGTPRRAHAILLLTLAGALLAGRAARAGGKGADVTPPPNPPPLAAGCSGPDPTGKDPLSGMTAVWAGDDSGVGPAKGATVLFEFCKGQVDVTGYKLPDGVESWTGTYAVTGGDLAMNVDGLLSIPAPGKPFRADHDTIEIPVALVKPGKGAGKAKLKKTPRAVQTVLTQAACEPVAQLGGQKPECMPPGGMGTHAFGAQCLYQDTSIDGALVSHALACVATCDANAAVPPTWKCDPCLQGFAGKTMYRSVGALAAAPRKKLLDAYAALGKRAVADAALARAADAAVAQAQADLAAIEAKAGHSAADVDKAQAAIGVAKHAAATVMGDDEKGPSDPANVRRAERRTLEKAIVDQTLGDLLPYQQACYYEPGPVEFTYAGTYSGTVNGDECTADLEALAVPMEIRAHSTLTSGKVPQAVYDSSFYTWRRSTGAVTMADPEDVGAAIVHEGFHWRQVGCGAPDQQSEAVAGALYRLHEIQAYNQSSQTAYYRLFLTPSQRRAWFDSGLAVQVAELARLIDGQGLCRKTKAIVPAKVKLTTAELGYVAHWLETVDSWFLDRMVFPQHDGAEGTAIWAKLCGGPGKEMISCANIDKDTSKITAPKQRCPEN